MIKVLLVDDHELVRLGLKNILLNSCGIQVIGEAKTGEQAILLAKRLSPDIVIMDIVMPGIGGVEAARRILRYNPSIKIITLTGYIDEPCFSNLINEGVLGYLSKDSGADELVRAIKTVYSGERYFDVSIARNRLKKPWNN